MIMGQRTPSTFSVGPNTESLVSSSFVTGIPASDVGLLAMSPGLASARYAFAGATPVSVQGSGVTGNGVLNNNSFVDVDFAGVGNYVSVNLDINLPDASGVPNNNIRLKGSTVATGGFNGGGNVFDGPATLTGAACETTNVICNQGRVVGFLTGPGGAATTVALTYGGGYSTTNNNGSTSPVVFGGAAVFGGNPQPITPPTTSLNYNFYYGYSGQQGGTNSLVGYDAIYSGVKTFIVSPGQDLQSYDTSAAGVSLTRNGISTGSRGSIGRYGDTEFLGWGYWDQTNQGNTLYTGLPNIALKDLHFLTGSPATNLTAPGVTGPNSLLGTIIYTQYANTIPTFTSGGATINGTLNSAFLTVDFTNIKVHATANTTFVLSGTPYSQTIDAQNMPLDVSTAGFSSGPSSTTGSINGFLSGNKGTFGGFVYGSDTGIGGVAGNIRGVAIFRR